ncbi:MAG: polynucleotide adenylyltransferase PcnB [Gammaproteobacteria bacterium]|nr:MAG: polynucleotide adenylyltransferase PcnB [Gammaproteobacteria bacterium]RKZ99278.1 MAG: polynucleotide adenylyltransferase PcnB [Gammaproteobacteria bacterium]
MLSLNKIFSRLKRNTSRSQNSNAEPLIVPRSQHTISRSQISPAALKVLYGLKDAGYEAYLVGGCVRDLLLGHEPKDFDVATNASPEQVNQLFKRSRLIGRRFKLVHVRYGREVIEVATFRAPPEAEQHVDQQGRIVRDNVFGTLEQDAWRRDFTINALYYNIRDFSIIDYTGGIADLDAGKIRLIGDVETRYREDPVRMLRAIRFIGKLGLLLDDETERLIPQLANLLSDIPAARLFDESLKLYLSGNAAVTHELLCHYGLFDCLFPQTAEILHTEQDGYPRTLLIKALENTDLRIDEGKPVTPAFLFAAILWEPVRQKWQENKARNIPAIPALQQAATEVISEQVKRVAIPKRFTLVSRDIWVLQPRLEQRFGKKAFRSLAHPKFRAGYDFLLLRSETGEPLTELADWWTQFQIAAEDEQQTMVKALASTGGGKHKPRRRRRRKPAAKSE